MLIAERFESYQGEGKSRGAPSIFIRFWGCNLRCRFDGVSCDTPYAVYTEKDKAVDYTVDEIVEYLYQSKLRNIIFTGGEPMLFQEEILAITSQLTDFTVEIETNGTIPPTGALMNAVDSFNISPKLASSNQETHYEEQRINLDALKSFPIEKSYLKFVVNDLERDIVEIKCLIEHLELEVFLMPQGKTKDEYLKNEKDVQLLAERFNWTFTPRDHIVQFNGVKGK